MDGWIAVDHVCRCQGTKAKVAAKVVLCGFKDW